MICKMLKMTIHSESIIFDSKLESSLSSLMARILSFSSTYEKMTKSALLKQLESITEKAQEIKLSQAVFKSIMYYNEFYSTANLNLMKESIAKKKEYLDTLKNNLKAKGIDFSRDLQELKLKREYQLAREKRKLQLQQDISDISSEVAISQQNIAIADESISRISDGIDFVKGSTSKVKDMLQVVSGKSSKAIIKLNKNRDFTIFKERIESSKHTKSINQNDLQIIRSAISIIEPKVNSEVIISSVPFNKENSTIKITLPTSSDLNDEDEDILCITKEELLKEKLYLPLTLKKLIIEINPKIKACVNEGETRKYIEPSDSSENESDGENILREEDDDEIKDKANSSSDENVSEEDSNQSDDQEFISFHKLEDSIPETLTHLTIYSKTSIDLKKQSNLKEFLISVLLKNIKHLEFIGFSNCNVFEDVLYNLDKYQSLKSLSFKMCANISNMLDDKLSYQELNSSKTTRFPSIESIKIKSKIENLMFYACKLRDADIEKVKKWVYSETPNLKCLNLSYNNLTAQIISALLETSGFMPAEQHKDRQIPYSIKMLNELPISVSKIILHNNRDLVSYLRQQQKSVKLREKCGLSNYNRLWRKIQF